MATNDMITVAAETARIKNLAAFTAQLATSSPTAENKSLATAATALKTQQAKLAASSGYEKAANRGTVLARMAELERAYKVASGQPKQVGAPVSPVAAKAAAASKVVPTDASSAGLLIAAGIGLAAFAMAKGHGRRRR